MQYVGTGMVFFGKALFLSQHNSFICFAIVAHLHIIFVWIVLKLLIVTLKVILDN